MADNLPRLLVCENKEFLKSIGVLEEFRRTFQVRVVFSLKLRNVFRRKLLTIVVEDRVGFVWKVKFPETNILIMDLQYRIIMVKRLLQNWLSIARLKLLEIGVRPFTEPQNHLRPFTRFPQAHSADVV